MVNRHIHTQLSPQQVIQRGPIPQIHPIARPTPLLLMLTFARHDVIEALRTRGRRAQPDLLVRRLFVEDVGSNRGKGDVENASLDATKISVPSQSLGDVVQRTYAILAIHVLLLLLHLLQLVH